MNGLIQGAPRDFDTVLNRLRQLLNTVDSQIG